MKNFTFPNDFFDFTKGVDCSNGELNTWINACYEHIKKEIKKGVVSPHACQRTGNSVVTMLAYKQDNGNYTIEVNVSKAYYSHTECDVEV